MTKSFSFPFISAVSILFAWAAAPAFAQHGGGGHGGGGGGFHGGGGGGFHSSGGGGFRAGGGGFRGGPPPAGAGFSRGTPGATLRSGGGFYARPGTNFSRPYGNSFNGSQRFGNSPSASPGVAGGQWHSFGGPASGRGPSGPQSGAGPSSNAGGFHVFSGNRGAGSAGTVRSFSGQGHEIFENTPASRNIVPKSQSLSTIHNSFSGSPAANSGFRSNSTLSASSRFGGGSALAGNRGFSRGVNTGNSFQQLRSTSRFGNRFDRFGRFDRFDRFGRFGRGCWDCGFGFGFGFGGWGFGWPWFGFGFWDPFWYDPWWGPGYGYGSYGYPYSNVYSDPNSGYYAPPVDNSNPPPAQDYEGSPDGNWVTPNGPSPSSAPNSGNLTVPVLIYLKSGGVYTVRDYWMIDGELHFILMNGVQNSVDLEQVDLPRTNTENAKSGVKFIYKSEPSITAPAPGGNGMPPGASEPSPPHQMNAVPQPEART